MSLEKRQLGIISDRHGLYSNLAPYSLVRSLRIELLEEVDLRE